MTIYTREIGILKNPESEWSKDEWQAKIETLVELDSGGLAGHVDISRLASSGKGMQLDWGAWIVYHTKHEIEFFIEKNASTSREDALKKISAFADDQTFVVVVTEC